MRQAAACETNLESGFCIHVVIVLRFSLSWSVVLRLGYMLLLPG